MQSPGVSVLELELLVAIGIWPNAGVLAHCGMFAATSPLSVRVQVVPDVTQSSRCPVVGTVAGPSTVVVVVAPLPHIVCAAADPLASCRVPASELSAPKTTAPGILNVQVPVVVIVHAPLAVI